MSFEEELERQSLYMSEGQFGEQRVLILLRELQNVVFFLGEAVKSLTRGMDSEDMRAGIHQARTEGHRLCTEIESQLHILQRQLQKAKGKAIEATEEAERRQLIDRTVQEFKKIKQDFLHFSNIIKPPDWTSSRPWESKKSSDEEEYKEQLLDLSKLKEIEHDFVHDQEEILRGMEELFALFKEFQNNVTEQGILLGEVERNTLKALQETETGMKRVAEVRNGQYSESHRIFKASKFKTIGLPLLGGGIGALLGGPVGAALGLKAGLLLGGAALGVSTGAAIGAGISYAALKKEEEEWEPVERKRLVLNELHRD